MKVIVKDLIIKCVCVNIFSNKNANPNANKG